MVALMPTDPILLAVLLGTIFVIAFTKGGFGGGFAILGIPALSFVMPAVDAAAVIAPLVLLMDVFTVRAFPPRTWSRPNLRVLVLPLLCGIALGGLTFALVDPAWVTLLIALVTLVFALRWFARRRVEQPRAALRPAGGAVGHADRLHHLRRPFRRPAAGDLPAAAAAGQDRVRRHLGDRVHALQHRQAGALSLSRRARSRGTSPPSPPRRRWCRSGSGSAAASTTASTRRGCTLWCHLLLVAIGLKLLVDGVLGVT